MTCGKKRDLKEFQIKDPSFLGMGCLAVFVWIIAILLNLALVAGAIWVAVYVLRAMNVSI